MSENLPAGPSRDDDASLVSVRKSFAGPVRAGCEAATCSQEEKDEGQRWRDV